MAPAGSCDVSCFTVCFHYNYIYPNILYIYSVPVHMKQQAMTLFNDQ